jgi:hypothetical protein
MKRTAWNRLLAFDDLVLVLIIPSLGDMDVDTVHQVIFGGNVNELHPILGRKARTEIRPRSNLCYNVLAVIFTDY